jgi:hypothetical protein
MFQGRQGPKQKFPVIVSISYFRNLDNKVQRIFSLKLDESKDSNYLETLIRPKAMKGKFSGELLRVWTKVKLATI